MADEYDNATFAVAVSEAVGGALSGKKLKNARTKLQAAFQKDYVPLRIASSFGKNMAVLFPLQANGSEIRDVLNTTYKNTTYIDEYYDSVKNWKPDAPGGASSAPPPAKSTSSASAPGPIAVFAPAPPIRAETEVPKESPQKSDAALKSALERKLAKYQKDGFLNIDAIRKEIKAEFAGPTGDFFVPRKVGSNLDNLMVELFPGIKAKNFETTEGYLAAVRDWSDAPSRSTSTASSSITPPLYKDDEEDDAKTSFLSPEPASLRALEEARRVQEQETEAEQNRQAAARGLNADAEKKRLADEEDRKKRDEEEEAHRRAFAEAVEEQKREAPAAKTNEPGFWGKTVSAASDLITRKPVEPTTAITTRSATKAAAAATPSEGAPTRTPSVMTSRGDTDSESGGDSVVPSDLSSDRYAASVPVGPRVPLFRTPVETLSEAVALARRLMQEKSGTLSPSNLKQIRADVDIINSRLAEMLLSSTERKGTLLCAVLAAVCV